VQDNRSGKPADSPRAHLSASWSRPNDKADARTKAPPEPEDRDERQIGFGHARVKRPERRQLTKFATRALAAAMREKRVHQIFVLSVLAKGAHAIFEVVAGIALYLVSTESIVTAITRWSYDAILDNRHDWLANKLLQFAGSFSVEQHNFYAFYLLSHGIIKGGLVVGLLREKLWAYPASVVVFTLFIAYQLYHYTQTHDFVLILLTIFDLFVIYLAIHEYRLLRKHLPTH
jgi:uncharacterized membrane protein